MLLEKFNSLPAHRQDKCDGNLVHLLSFHVISLVIIAKVVLDLYTCLLIQSMVFEENSATRRTLSNRLIYSNLILIILFCAN